MKGADHPCDGYHGFLANLMGVGARVVLCVVNGLFTLCIMQLYISTNLLKGKS